MKFKSAAILICFFLLSVLSVYLLQAQGTPFKYEIVVRVVDGDTIILSNGERVRYIGVDTPETRHPKKSVECFGKEASGFNKKLVEKKKVRLELDIQQRDRYGRLLAYVFLEDGTFVNAELLREGYAQILTIPPNVKYQAYFLKLQKKAVEKKIGLWGNCISMEEDSYKEGGGK